MDGCMDSGIGGMADSREGMKEVKEREGRMDGWTVEGKKVRKERRRTDGLIDGRTSRWMDRWMDGWMDVRINGQRRARVDRCMDACVRVIMKQTFRHTLLSLSLISRFSVSASGTV